MIITVTLNTGIDHTLVVPYFHWGETIRTQAEALGMGGKATDASWVLGELGIPSLAMGFAAGASGRQMDQMLRQRGVETDFTWVEGETRSNVVIISCAGEGQTTLTTNSLKVKPEHLEEFKCSYEKDLNQADCVIIGGSLPPDVPLDIYTGLVRLARRLSVPVVFDASGPALAAGLEGCPTLVKPNRDELEQVSGRKIESVEQAYQAARQVGEQYGCIVVATLGAKGALAVTSEGAYFIEPPGVEVKSAAGAGDAILAGLAHSLAAKLPLVEGLRLGFAAAAAVLMTLPTADCRREDVTALLPQVRICQYPVHL